jgi:hypothetical protein
MNLRRWLMKYMNALTLFLGFLFMFGLFLIFYPFAVAVAAWAWWTVTASTALISRTVIDVFLEWKRGASIRLSLANNLNGQTAASLILFSVSIPLSFYHPFLLPTLFGAACGIIAGIPLRRRHKTNV